MCISQMSAPAAEQFVHRGEATDRTRPFSVICPTKPTVRCVATVVVATRLINCGWFRVGTERYAKESKTFGITTLRKDHVRVRGHRIAFDFRGKHDSYDHQLQVTLLAAADSLAAAAGLVMGKTSRTPAVLIRGFPWDATESHAAMLLRTPEKDLFL